MRMTKRPPSPATKTPLTSRALNRRAPVPDDPHRGEDGDDADRVQDEVRLAHSCNYPAGSRPRFADRRAMKSHWLSLTRCVRSTPARLVPTASCWPSTCCYVSGRAAEVACWRSNRSERSSGGRAEDQRSTRPIGRVGITSHRPCPLRRRSADRDVFLGQLGDRLAPRSVTRSFVVAIPGPPIWPHWPSPFKLPFARSDFGGRG